MQQIATALAKRWESCFGIPTCRSSSRRCAAKQIGRRRFASTPLLNVVEVADGSCSGCSCSLSRTVVPTCCHMLSFFRCEDDTSNKAANQRKTCSFRLIRISDFTSFELCCVAKVPTRSKDARGASSSILRMSMLITMIGSLTQTSCCHVGG